MKIKFRGSSDPLFFNTAVSTGLFESQHNQKTPDRKCGQASFTEFYISSCPHPYWVRSRENGFSPGLKNMPPAYFLPTKSCRPPSSNPNTIKKRLTANAVRLFLVGVSGFEPEASWTRTKRDTKLRHTPIAKVL